MTTREELCQLMQARILVMSGAMGTYLQQLLSEPPSGCFDMLNLSNPDIIARVNREYVEAGADIIKTNSFNSNAISLADYGMADRAFEIAKLAAHNAREVADAAGRRVFVAGVIGPTSKSACLSADVSNPAAREITFDQLYEAYREQVRGLKAGGADLYLIETIFDTLNAKAAIKAVLDISEEMHTDLPIMLSATLGDASGRTLSGQTVDAFYASVAHARPVSVGLNCGFGAEKLMPYIEQLARVAHCAVSFHPNAGLPNVLGEYDETPERFAAHARQCFEKGIVNIYGGCCGTTPEHIRQLAALVGNERIGDNEGIGDNERIGDNESTGATRDNGSTGRGGCKDAVGAAAPSPTKAALSGLEPLALDGRFVHIGERTNVAGSAKFKRLVKEGKWDDALSIARTQIADGADVIDVCMDDGMIDGVEAMTTFLRLIASEPDIARVPVMIDSSDWAVLCAGLACVQGKAIVNSISLKEGEAVFLNRARHIRKMGAAAVVMLFDEEGQADTYARKVAVARRAYKLLTADGFPAGDIIFDPNVLAVATGIAAHASYGKAFIEACRTIRNEMPDVHLSGGISNLSFAFRGNNALRQAMHAVFLHHATAAGLDMSILNPAQRMDYATIEPALHKAVEDAVLDTDPEAAERLLAFATTAAPAAPVAPVAPAASAASVATVASATSVAPAAPAASATTVASVAPVAPAAPLAERISRALTTGNTSQIAADALEAYQELGSAMAVIDTYLMPAMEQVGELFGAGKMFLPQVVKSARVMKEAVAALSPFMTAASESEGETRPLVVLATVRGDVHDIGKHIAAVVMQCNGFRVEDLGVMVEPAAIADAAERMGACCVGLSGLITPSLTEMERTVAELERRGLNVPVMVGGATTSPLHTALKIAPAYPSGAVFHCRAAADNPSVLRHLVSAHSAEYIAAHKAEQATQREAYYRSEAERKPLLTLTEAQRRKRIKPLSKVVVPTAEACRPIWWDSDESLGDTSPQSTLLSHINWRAFYTAWGIKPTIADTAPDVIKLRADAERLLAQFLNKRLLRLQVFAQVLPAVSEGDSMLITAPGGKIHRFALPRTLYDEPTTRCMADLLLAKNEGIPHASSPTDYVCPFLCSTGVGLAQLQAQFRSQGDDYHAILAKLLADRLAEALAEMLQAHLRDKLRWGKHHQRLAIGYPACPDHSQKQQVMDILSINPQASGLRLTESHMITPAEAVCGFIFAINN